tara:strand:- start:220 stop:462 length:243 start_codon:yes stop_codon:yes gene_type:complete
MREKYIDEKLGTPIYIFGTSYRGNVDVANGNGDLVTKVNEKQAFNLISHNDKIMELVYLFNEMYPNEFKEVFDELFNPRY